MNDEIDLFIEMYDFIKSNSHLTMSNQWKLWCGLKGIRVESLGKDYTTFRRVHDFINNDTYVK
jgi:hypothetical protein